MKNNILISVGNCSYNILLALNSNFRNINKCAFFSELNSDFQNFNIISIYWKEIYHLVYCYTSRQTNKNQANSTIIDYYNNILSQYNHIYPPMTVYK